MSVSCGIKCQQVILFEYFKNNIFIMKKQKNAPRPKFVNTRKAIRKEKRLQKKLHKQEHYQKKKIKGDIKKHEPGRFVKRPVDLPEVEPKKNKKKNKSQPSTLEILNKERQKELCVADKLKREMEEQRRQILLKANEEEDKIIKKLEKQLGLNKSKNKNNYFSEDGLDYLLEICDRTTSEQIVAAEKHLAEVEGDSDFEEDLAVVTGKELPDEKDKGKKKNKSEKDVPENSEENDESLDEDTQDYNMGVSDEEQSGSDDEMEDENEDSKDLSELEDEDASDSYESDNSERKDQNEKKSTKKEKIVSEDDLGKVFSDDEVSHLSDDEDMEHESLHEDSKDVGDKESNKKPDIWEDIYGRKRDKDGNIIKEEKGVYVPPHLRNKDSASDKDLAQLKRQIKSVLNKLAGTNLHWACTSIENLYSSHSRNSVNTVLSQLWTDATVGTSATPDRLVAEHAALVSVLHANVASEIGAHFLQELAMKFDEMVDGDQPMEDKRLENLTSCLAHLYSFKIYHSALVYDILARLMDQVTEKRVDCVLTALRCVGGVLRKDDPLALKNFIHDTQARVASLNESVASGSRIKFLLEVLMAVKNNNLNKIPNYEPTYVENLKKSTRSIVRKGNYITPLNIRLEDLLKADERGKWWIVGSAWEGNRAPQEKETVKPAPSTDQKLLELARKQRMNTDVRRSIFCVIMSAQDFMDAFEKLQHLGLRGQQEREIVHVLLACCMQEKAYNPYYAVLAQKLSDFDRKYQLSIQFSVWDKIKEMETLSKQGLTNLAQFLIHLIMGKGLPLSVLKIIQFSDLNKKSVRFMRQILLAVIMNDDLQATLEVFQRISKSPKLHMFRESLRLFIQHFLIKNAGKKSAVLSEEEMETLRERVAEVEKILTIHESKLRF
ncbi:nucleolar MIF4G domain-containing protein 1 homolog [Battus philenor]|uniref:nucleolar MIF4G domain-containing protein 1 homolog n=1 Tax=Battus philenor TaxID=42288 RepID=UPI0035CEF74E